MVGWWCLSICKPPQEHLGFRKPSTSILIQFDWSLIPVLTAAPSRPALAPGRRSSCNPWRPREAPAIPIRYCPRESAVPVARLSPPTPPDADECWVFGCVESPPSGTGTVPGLVQRHEHSPCGRPVLTAAATQFLCSLRSLRAFSPCSALFHDARANPADLGVQVANMKGGSAGDVIEASQNFSSLDPAPREFVACARQPQQPGMVRELHRPAVQRVPSGQGGHKILTDARHKRCSEFVTAHESDVRPFVIEH